MYLQYRRDSIGRSWHHRLPNPQLRAASPSYGIRRVDLARLLFPGSGLHDRSFGAAGLLASRIVR